MKTIEELYDEIVDLKDIEVSAKKAREIVEAEIVKLCQLEVVETGSVSTNLDGFKVTLNVPKNVKWDQDKLLETWNYIENSWGGNPEEYIDAKYSVSETAYKVFPSPVKQLFQDARTVKGGKPSIKIVKGE